MPNNELNIEEKMRIFSIRNRMINIPSNFVSREKNNNKCICEEKENMEHIYECKYLNEKRAEIKFEEIFENDLKKQKKIMKRFENCLIMKNIIESQPNHVIPFGDPPSSLQ